MMIMTMLSVGLSVYHDREAAKTDKPIGCHSRLGCGLGLVQGSIY